MIDQPERLFPACLEDRQSLTGRLRAEHLNVELFFSVADAQRKITEWQRDYNEDRPQLLPPGLGTDPSRVGSDVIPEKESVLMGISSRDRR